MFWLGLAVAVCFIPGYTGASIPTQWVLLSCVVPLALWRKGEMTLLHWAGVAFLAYACLSLAWARDFYLGIWGVWTWTILALVVWLGSTEDSLNGLFRGLAIGMSVSSTLAVIQYLGWNPVVTINPLRPAGLFFNPMAHGEILTLTIVALVSLRLWPYIPALLPGLALSGSRGAFIALGVGLLCVYLRRLPTILFAIAALLFVIGFAYSPTDTMRLQIWRVAWENLNLRGWGTGSFMGLMYMSSPTNLMHPEYAHNDYLQLAFEYGLVAAIPLGIFLLVLRQVSAPEWPILVTFLFMGTFSFPLYMPVTAFIAALCTGRLARGWSSAWYRSGERRHGVVLGDQPRGSQTDRVREAVIPILP